MKDTLKAGIGYEFSFNLSDAKTVPALYPEAREFQVMPKVFATGFMVGFIEWACIQAINPHIDWPNEQSVGIHINVGHVAATPPGMEVRAQVKLIEVDGRRLVFEVAAFDEEGIIGRGFHERMVVDAERFNRKLEDKAQSYKSEVDHLGALMGSGSDLHWRWIVMEYPLYIIDAFTEKPFSGNPAAVCPLTEWLEDGLMQRIAAENNLSETAFFVPVDNGFKLRWFTPKVEVSICGHATLAPAPLTCILYRHSVGCAPYGQIAQ